MQLFFKKEVLLLMLSEGYSVLPDGDIADASLLSSGGCTVRSGDDEFGEAVKEVVHGFVGTDEGAGVEIHPVGLAAEEVAVRGDLQRGHEGGEGRLCC